MSELPSSEGLDPYPATDAPNPTTLSAAKSRQSITRGLADFSNTIRLPVHVVETLPDYLTCNATEESRAACSHDHSLAESALRMQPLSLESYLEMQWSTHYRDSISTIDDRIIDPSMFTDDPEQVLVETEWVAKVNHLVDTLPEREAEIIRRRFGWYDDEPQTLDLIGQHFNLTRERIRQLEKKSLEHLREIVEISSIANKQSVQKLTPPTRD
ncbi:sigma factor-like helix-turn-helix DNA-binding protein [Brevibacterium casei]